MDTVIIEDLKVDAVIGVFDWEKQVQQPLHFDLDMAWDNHKPAQSDDLQDALDYGAVTQYVEDYVGSKQYELLETLLEGLASGLMQHFSIHWLAIRVRKPAVVPQARSVGIRIERGVRP